MKHHTSIKKAGVLYAVGIISFFSALHLSIPSYFNSSFLATFTDEKTVGLIYLAISIVTIIGLLAIDTVLRKIGNFRTSLALILIQIAVSYGIVNSTSPGMIIFFSIMGMSVISLIGLTIDIFIQKSTDIGHTGSVRGFVMTAINMAWILGPLIGGTLIIEGNTPHSYRGIYVASFLLLFPLLYLVYKNFNKFHDSHYIKISALQTFIRILKNKDISKIFIINIVLQTFYAWMTVYVPIYLHKTLHFDWSEVSLIFTIMLIPFILVELPLGKLADKKWGEKELMAIGFTIIGISTCALVFFDFRNFVAWAIMLFITRIGAATAEVMIETYFFKKIDGRDPEILSIFRITRPFSYFIAPLITTIGLVYTTDSYLFVILGIICLMTLYPISTIKDTN